MEFRGQTDISKKCQVSSTFSNESTITALVNHVSKNVAAIIVNVVKRFY